MASSRTTGETDPDDPVGYFLEDLRFHGKSERTREAYERVLREFEAFLSDSERNPAGASLDPGEATQRECMAWVHGLRGDLASSTVATYASYLHRFYAYMTQVGAFDSNPMALVVEEMTESIDKDPTRREISIPQMREFVAGVSHPLEKAVVVTLLKTGMRVGELCNLDLRDLRLSGEPAEAYRLGTRPQLDGRGESVFVASDIARGDVVDGEQRTAANKRKRATVIPVDEGLAAVLTRWLAIRPDPVSPADPLFVSTSREWGRRLTPQMVRNAVETHAREAGWYRTGGGAEENVTPHYFRHFFTTHLRDRTGDRGIVKYLRGDVAEDIIDTYTHNWGDRVREVYEENVYSLV
ncbi:tyrosine-type recombinase/integrase [Halorussus salilacus]|uniref:tyrosine-type recombinase/integrase n=1 Tax=Halorussus salilacus TaxID=2953750 RepID=UPI00209EACDC|nr:tyrosine-type recombinase/integrase [Halorussus salilacus]USZ68428.1 tyrosine-type recombinase/integrase [Halorussus salilacus]